MVQKKMSQELIKRMIQQHGNGKLILLLFQKLGWGEEGGKYYRQKTFAALYIFMGLFIGTSILQRDHLITYYFINKSDFFSDFSISSLDTQSLVRLPNTKCYQELSYACKADERITQNSKTEHRRMCTS